MKTASFRKGCLRFGFSVDGIGEEVRGAQVSVDAGQDGAGQVSGSDAAAGEDLVPEPQDEVEETGEWMDPKEFISFKCHFS